MKSIGVTSSKITKVSSDQLEQKDDLVVVEEPLEILLGHGPEHDRSEFPLTVTMRTPGADKDLVLGFLLSEGIISKPDDFISIYHCQTSEHPENTVRVELAYDLKLDPELFTRNFLSNSSCGICGRAVLENIEKKRKPNTQNIDNINESVLFRLSEQIDSNQTNFKYTGGIHAAALFDLSGNLILLREDIGRHNALDKIIGAMLNESINPAGKILWLSSRIGFELVQKALISGLQAIVALGAPSNLAVEIAKENGLFLVGFLSKKRFNIYSGIENLVTEK